MRPWIGDLFSPALSACSAASLLVSFSCSYLYESLEENVADRHSAVTFVN